ncbi:hypothetical protein Pcinc_028046 [Petrolisthes cinctipes]|uniref:Secreted protein n=1 Tax=Petrolisthes cinctipes TaxID=88211 RepID=A0AAE1K9H2_PETCI|nr:hypothetical protein Pcinc_028046 [Petrolisthes cinctipes]
MVLRVRHNCSIVCLFPHIALAIHVYYPPVRQSLPPYGEAVVGAQRETRLQCGRVGVDGRRRRCRSHTSSSRGPSVRDIADVAPPRDITSPVFESLAKIFCVRKYHLSESNVKSPLTNTETRGNTIT